MPEEHKTTGVSTKSSGLLSRRRLILAGLLSLFIIVVAFPLIFVELTVPSELRNSSDTFKRRTNDVVNVSIIYNYKKEGRRVAVVRAPITYIDDSLGTGDSKVIAVTRGYKTDFASLPLAARLFFNPFGEYAEAAIIHDWLYAIGEPGRKREADLIFYRVMIDDGVPPVLARYFYTAVRFGTLFDGGGYGRDTEWTEGFYSTILNTDYPVECLPEKPETAFLDASDLTSMHGVDTSVLMAGDSLDQPLMTAMLGFSLQGLDPLYAAWQESLYSIDCQTQISGLLRLRAQRTMGDLWQQMLDNWGEEQSAGIAEISTDFLLISEFGRAVTRDELLLPYTSAYLKYEYGADLPEDFYCAGVNTQLIALLTVLSVAPDQPWPDISCPELSARNDQLNSPIIDPDDDNPGIADPNAMGGGG